MPLVLLAIVYLPLREALDEVAWQVRVRAAVNASLGRDPHKFVQSRVRVERHEVNVRVVLLGKTADADASRARLGAEIEEVSGVVPRIEVLAIPDAKAFAGLETNLRSSNDPLPLPPSLQSPAEQLESARTLIRSNVARLWPSAAAGEPLIIEVGTSESGPLRVRVVHQGEALKADGREGLVRSLGAALSREIQLIDVAIPVDTLTRSDGDLRFVSGVSSGVRASAAINDISVCVVQPQPPQNKRRVDAREQELADTLRDVLALHPRVTTALGEGWSVRFIRGTCKASAPADAGATDAAAPK
jgi:hypothetical protein